MNQQASKANEVTPRQAAYLLGFVAVIALALWRCDAWWDGLGADLARQRQQEDAQRAKEVAEAKQRDDAKRAAAEQEKQRLAAVDSAERALSPEDRSKAISAALPDVCEAKRLLSKAPDPKAPGLAAASAATKTAEMKQLMAERPEFEKTRGVTCRDGDASECLCHAQHRGCCSHHGGIAACTPYPTEIDCPSPR